MTPISDASRVAYTEKIKKDHNDFNSSIPVVDMSLPQHKMLEQMQTGLEKGFFAVINSNANSDLIEAGYAAFERFFASSDHNKMKLNRPETMNQRGFVFTEKALGSDKGDCKEFFHIGPSNNDFSSAKELEIPIMHLYKELIQVGQPIMEAMALSVGLSGDIFTYMTRNGENLMRAINYFPDPENGIWAAAHTDIDLLTVLPCASGKGLQLLIDGQWVDVTVPKNAFIVNVGDMGTAFTNGKWRSCIHRVQNTENGVGRQSIVMFFHPTNDTIVEPLMGGRAHYPNGTRLEYLMLRLFSLGYLKGNAAKEVIEGRFINQIKEMVDDQVAAPDVITWYEGFKKTLDSFIVV